MKASECIVDLVPGSGPAEVTAALQSAMNTCSESGGGRVVVPGGSWVCRTLTIPSGVDLHLSPGAVIEPDTDLSQYPAKPRGHNKDRQPFHLIYAENASNIALTGRGRILGNGMAFWDPPLEGSPFYRAKPARISPLVDFKVCRNVLIRDITIEDSPGWTVHTYNCNDVVIDRVTVDNHLYGPNTDGFDINGCRHVRVSNCRLHGCDDNIIIKATEDARPCEYITVTNCVLESNCAAIGLGAETRSGIRHVTVSNCAVINSIRMIQIIMWDGGVVENVTFSNISGRAMTDLGTDRAIHFDVQEHHGENPELGTLRNIICQGIVCETRGRVLLTAEDGGTMDNIILRDVILTYPEVEDPSVSVPASHSNQLSNFNPDARVARAAVVAENVNGLQLENIVTRWPERRDRIAARMLGLWAKNCSGLINCPLLTSSDGSKPVTELIGPNILM